MLRPVRCPNFKGFAPYQQIKRQVHLLIHDCSNNIVRIWSLPPAIREATTGIFLWPASGLYDTIKGDEFEYNNFSHDRVPPTSGDLLCLSRVFIGVSFLF